LTENSIATERMMVRCGAISGTDGLLVTLTSLALRNTASMT